MVAQAGPFWVAVGARLRAARHQKGLQPNEVEAIVSRHFRTPALASYERGDRKPQLDDLCLLARTYGCSISDFIPDDWERLL